MSKFFTKSNRESDTGKTIKLNGPTHKKLMKECAPSPPKSPKSSLVLTQDQCNQFRNNPSINPLTGKTTKTDGATFVKVGRACGLLPAASPPGCPKGASPSRSSSPKRAQITYLSPEQQTAFYNNQSINPVTGKSIELGGKVHKELVEAYKYSVLGQQAPIKSPGRKARKSKDQLVLSSDDATKFYNDQTRNPLTGKLIKKDGKTHKALIQAYYRTIGQSPPSPVRSSPSRVSINKPYNMTPQLCQQFYQNQTVNPATGHAISPGKGVHLQLTEQCKKLGQSFQSPKSQFISPGNLPLSLPSSLFHPLSDKLPLSPLPNLNLLAEFNSIFPPPTKLNSLPAKLNFLSLPKLNSLPLPKLNSLPLPKLNSLPLPKINSLLPAKLNLPLLLPQICSQSTICKYSIFPSIPIYFNPVEIYKKHINTNKDKQKQLLLIVS